MLVWGGLQEGQMWTETGQGLASADCRVDARATDALLTHAEFEMPGGQSGNVQNGCGFVSPA